MTAGVFARRSRLSPKALRLYGEMGLLDPVHVDPTNGYRYYADHQVEPALLIGLLRRLEMPLATIAAVIELEGADAVAAIGDYWKHAETEHQSKRELVRYLTKHLTGEGETMYDVTARSVPQQQIATIERRVLAPDLPNFIGDGMTTVARVLAEAGATPGAPFVVYHGRVDLDSDGPVEVCVPYEGTVTPTGDVRLRVEPAHDEAFTRITKGEVAFPKILEAYEAVERWVAGQGVNAGSPREVYFTDWDAAGTDDPACDIALPYTS